MKYLLCPCSTQADTIFLTHHIKYLSEGDPNPDHDCLGCIVHGPDLPVIVCHEVVEQARLLLCLVLLDWV